MYKIGELSRLSQIPVKTLRFYDAEGILVPDVIDRVKEKKEDKVTEKDIEEMLDQAEEQ
jgi:hypothetical protein